MWVRSLPPSPRAPFTTRDESRQRGYIWSEKRRRSEPMSVRRLAAEQPDGFAFTPENLEWARAQIKKYPERRQASAVLPILWRAQEQMGGWLPEPALRYVAGILGMAYIRVYEIATFYTMFNLAP